MNIYFSTLRKSIPWGIAVGCQFNIFSLLLILFLAASFAGIRSTLRGAGRLGPWGPLPTPGWAEGCAEAHASHCILCAWDLWLGCGQETDRPPTQKGSLQGHSETLGGLRKDTWRRRFLLPWMFPCLRDVTRGKNIESCNHENYSGAKRHLPERQRERTRILNTVRGQLSQLISTDLPLKSRSVAQWIFLFKPLQFF